MDYKLLTKTDIADMLTISPSTLDRLRRQNKFIAPIMIGDMPRWRDIDVLNWLMAKVGDAS